MGPGSQIRTWSGVSPDPFRRTGPVSPFRSLPSGNDVFRIQPDLLHCFNLGFGKDLAASSILLMSKLGIFGEGKIQAKLTEAYNDFQQWCLAKHKSSSLKKFELKTFKVQSTLDPNQSMFSSSIQI